MAPCLCVCVCRARVYVRARVCVASVCTCACVRVSRPCARAAEVHFGLVLVGRSLLL